MKFPAGFRDAGRGQFIALQIFAASKIDITVAPKWLRVDEIKIDAATLVYRLSLVAPAPIARRSSEPDSHGAFTATSSADR
jgi:hypothetical protein